MFFFLQLQIPSSTLFFVVPFFFFSSLFLVIIIKNDQDKANPTVQMIYSPYQRRKYKRKYISWNILMAKSQAN
jgi:hypothetical protein